MLQIKQQSKTSTQKRHPYALPVENKQYISRISKNYSPDICKTLETQQSISQPHANKQPQIYTKYFNDNYSIIAQSTSQRQNYPQKLSFTFVHKSIPNIQIQNFFRDINILRFLTAQTSSQKNFISRKQEVIRNLKISIQQKQAQATFRKTNIERKIKKNHEKKHKLKKLDDFIKKQQFREQLQWAAKISNMRLKLKKTRQHMLLNLVQDEENNVRSSYNQRRRTNSKYKIQIPVVIHPHGHYRTTRSHYDNPYNNDYYSQVHYYNPETYCDFQPQFTRTPSRNISHHKLKTQSTDGFYTKRESKLTPRYLQDYDEYERNREPVTQRKHSRKVEEPLYPGKISNNFLDGFKKTQQRLLQNMQLGLQSNKKEQNLKKPSFLKHQTKGPKYRVIKRIDSQIVSVDMSSLRDESCMQQYKDDDLGVLLQQSISKEESKYIKAGASKHKQPKNINYLSQDPSITKQKQQIISLNSHNKQHQKLQPQLTSYQYNQYQIIKISPVKQPIIKQSIIQIEMSDQESSKINKRQKQRTQDQHQLNQYRSSIEEACALIQQQSEDTSMRTTPNNHLSPKETSYNDKTTSITPTPSHSSKPKTNEEKNQRRDQEVFPLGYPPNLQQAKEYQGISNIQLNTMSKQSRKLNHRYNQPCSTPQRKNSEDDNLMTITLVGQSKISRLKTQFKAVLQQNEVIERIKDQKQKQIVASQEKKQEQSNDLDIDFQLSAESNYYGKSKFKKANNSVIPPPPKDQIQRRVELSKEQKHSLVQISE